MFTNTEKTKIRWYLGWPNRFNDTWTALELALDSLETEEEDIIRTAIAHLDDLSNVRLPSACGRLKATKVGSIHLRADIEIMMLRSEGRRCAGQLASQLGVTIGHDVFSPTGPKGEFGWAGFQHGSRMIF